MIAFLVNHLWQSTLGVVVAALVLRLLNIDSARWRYGVWFAASLKFLVPLAMLSMLGTWLSAQRAEPAPVFELTAGLQRIAEPMPSAVLSGLIGEALLAAWLAGVVVVLARWLRRAAALRAVFDPASHGADRESGALPAPRRAGAMTPGSERLAGLPARIAVRHVAAHIEPGIAGVLRPMLLLPEGIEERITAPELGAIVAHELTHYRRRDNLTGAVHMLVEALFWFFPPVWWLGARLLEERERACDDAVVLEGHDRHTYAEALLKVCESCVAARLACVPGVSGGSLSARVEHIIGGAIMVNLPVPKKLVLALIGAAVAAAPVGLGLVTGGGIVSAQPEAAANDSDILPIVKVAPKYPPGALERALEGHVLVEYTVNEQGGVEDLEVVESSSSLFEQAALEAVAKFKYGPFDRNGVPVSLPKRGVRSVIRFALGGREDQFLPIVHPAPHYPEQALEQGLEGFVIVEYTVTEQGRTEDLRVIQSSSSLFDEAALESAAQYQYEPRVRNGVAVSVRGVRSVLRFEMPE